ncbi:hypothetical protein BWQ93_11775 [Sphingopyxis sp. QXT-31]|uniref:hypothetical protein n=1 Tax=Sphingopyxis sp. QXT-31 TaxID=1357916 RepID=UPI000979128E|nr:hypothetical protein [Sphingopyxis sp. QXT-31]APZ99093.1 hypothetical protein BWQ93_11775 [Sphingopyxis sp. QXT-31]
MTWLALAALLLAAQAPAHDPAAVDKAKARLSAEIVRLTADDAAYRRRCARFGNVPIDLARDDLTDDQVVCAHARYRRTAGHALPPHWAADVPPPPAEAAPSAPLSERPK